jgi:A118 family predicted phage portal protein
MFQKILQWLREVWFKMTTSTDVKSAMQVEIAASPAMLEALLLWTGMYLNNSPWLSENPADKIESLNLSASIAGEIARNVTIEMKMEVTGSARALYLDEQLELVEKKLREAVEIGCAKGGLVFKPYISGEKILVDIVQADQFFPVAFDSTGKITSCVFSDVRTVGAYFYTRLEFHQTELNNIYTIKNQAFKSSVRGNLGYKCELTEVDAWKDLEPEGSIENVEHPLFAYFRYPLANNIDPTSPLGVSCYARATDLIKQADKQWTNILWEFESGQRALYVDELAFGKDPVTNKPILPHKKLYRTLNVSGNIGDEELLHEWSPKLREVGQLAGLDAILRKIEFQCGIAYGTLSNPATIDKTATEIKASNQRTYSTIVDTQKALENAFEDLLYAMDVWATLGNLAPQGAVDLAIEFDDSVVTDTDTQFQQDLRMVTARLMSDVEFRMRNFGENEQQAKEKLALIPKEEPTSLFKGF